MKKEFITVLLKVQKELPVVGKDTQAYNYKYAPIEKVWDKVGEVITGNGFAINSEVSADGVLTTATHEHGSLKSFIPFSHLNLKPQEKGSEITYARRYNLTAMFNIIVAGEDDDAIVTKEAKHVEIKCITCGKVGVSVKGKTATKIICPDWQKHAEVGESFDCK